MKSNTNSGPKSITYAIEVMKAFQAGKQIQGRLKGHPIWLESHSPGWDWANYEYRVAPPPPTARRRHRAWACVSDNVDDVYYYPTYKTAELARLTANSDDDWRIIQVCEVGNDEVIVKTDECCDCDCE